MPKSKNSPALYELIARDRVKGRPDLQVGRAQKSFAATAKPKPAAKPAPQPAPRAKPTPRAEPPAKPSKPRLPWNIGRFLKDPTRITALICAAALISFGAFIFFKWRQGELPAVAAAPLPADGVAASRDGLTLFAPTTPPRVTARDGTAQSASARLPGRVGDSPPSRAAGPMPAAKPSSTKTPPAGRQTGLNYVVVESFAADARSDAEAAVAYLTKHGVPCTIEKRSRGGFYVVSSDGYPGSDTKLDRLVGRVRALGTDYFEQGGRYRFQCFAKRYDGGSW